MLLLIWFLGRDTGAYMVSNWHFNAKFKSSTNDLCDQILEINEDNVLLTLQIKAFRPYKEYNIIITLTFSTWHCTWPSTLSINLFYIDHLTWQIEFRLNVRKGIHFSVVLRYCRCSLLHGIQISHGFTSPRYSVFHGFTSPWYSLHQYLSNCLRVKLV